ncbi:MAG: hypothetical protein IPJ77_20775 [Planctomycetes bacterium]|nr:hypothetical protein [Planctomycetota bacterium]
MDRAAADPQLPASVRGRKPRFVAGIRAVVQRELGGWFDAPVAWIALALALFATSSWFLNEFFLANRLDLAPFFDRLPWVYVLLVPALAMRVWSEDLRARTFELWMTLPLTPLQVVLGKYVGALVVLAAFLAGTLPIVAFLCTLGSPDLGRIAAGYAGAFLLGAQLLALGQLLSALFADALVAFLASAVLSAVLLAAGEERVVAVLDGLAPALGGGRALADVLSPLPRYGAFVGGSVGLAAVLWFAATAAAFLWANVRVAERARS